MRKALILLLLAACAATLGAAGTADTQAAAAGTADFLNPPGVFPVVKQPWTMTVMFPQDPLVEDMDTNKFTKYMEAKTGIKVSWQLIPAKNVQEKVNLVLASGTDLPDVMLGVRLSNDAQVQYGSQGLLVPLTKYVDELSVEFKKVLALPQFKTFRAQLTAPDGHIYSLPKISECYQCEYGQRLYINKTWLDKLGLAVPKTTDEFYAALKAFKTRDPNGNGKADEIPLVGAITGWHTEIDAQILSSFIYNDGRGANRMVLKNGKIDVVYNTPEWRDGLRYLAKLTREGLLDPVSFTQDNNQFKQLGGSSEAVLLGAFPGGTVGAASSPNSPTLKQYVVLPPLKGPKGVQTTGYFPTIPQAGLFVITSANKHPEASFRWADWLYNEEPSLFMRFGEKGVDWIEAPKGALDPFGKQALLEPILAWGSVQNAHWTFDNPGYSTRQMQVSQVVNPEARTSHNTLFIGETPIYEAVAPGVDGVVPSLFFTEAELDQILDAKTTINGYVEESIARFATGDLDIEKDWAGYLAELENMGLKKYIEVSQKVYDRQYGRK